MLCAPLSWLTQSTQPYRSLRDFSGGTYISLQNKSGPWPSRAIMRRMRAAVSDLSCYITIIYKMWSENMRPWGEGTWTPASWLIFSFPMATIVILLKSFDALYTVLTISNSVPFPKSLLPVCMHAHAHTHTRTHTHISVHPSNFFQQSISMSCFQTLI